MKIRILLITLLVFFGLSACTKKASTAASGTPAAGAMLVIASGVAGANGGTISGNGITLSIPAGALAQDTQITIGSASSPGADAIYQFSPAGTLFSVPVGVTLPVPTGLKQPVVYWSLSSNPIDYWTASTGQGFAGIGGTVNNGSISVSVTNLSNGYVSEYSPYPQVFPYFVQP